MTNFRPEESLGCWSEALAADHMRTASLAAALN